MNRVAVGMLAAGLLVVAACEEQTPTNGTGTTGQTGDRTGAGQPPARTPTTPPTGAADAAKQQAMQTINQQLDSSRQQIDQLRGMESQVPADKRDQYEQTMQQVQTSYSNVVGQVDKMRSSTGTEWRDIQTQLTTSMNELNQHIQKAKALVQGGQQPGGETPPSEPPATPPSSGG